MAESHASAEGCRLLYAVMDEVKQLAPWQWMTENDIFGVQGPDDQEPDFVSVMGMAGEHYAVAAYLGVRGMFQFWHFVQNQATAEPEELLQIPQLQASWEDRDMLKTLGRKTRGRKAWPQLRSYQPGLLPWHLESAEVERLRLALEQVLDVAPRFKTDATLIHVRGQNRFLVRVAERQGDQVVWRDEVRAITQAAEVYIEFEMDLQLLAEVQQLPHVANMLEIDLFLMPMPIHEPGQRPYFSFNLLIAESKSGTIVATKLLQPLPSMEAMWAKIPLVLAQTFANLGIIPAAVHVTSPVLMQLLPILSQELDFQIKQKRRLPKLDSAKQEMLGMLGRFY